MFKSIAVVAALTLGATGAMAAEVGIRNSHGTSHQNIYGGQSWHNYNGSIQSGMNASGSAAGVTRSSYSNSDSSSVRSGSYYPYSYRGHGYGRADTDGDGRGASCERGYGSFCEARSSASNSGSEVNRVNSQFTSFEREEQTYNGGSRNGFDGGSFESFSETSTFAR